MCIFNRTQNSLPNPLDKLKKKFIKKERSSCDLYFNSITLNNRNNCFIKAKIVII